MFALVDINNFYVSCERVFNPKLRNKAVVVLSNNDGCVIARSNEAKKSGIKMGAVYFETDKFLKENKVEVYSSNYPLYADFSNRMVSVLREFVDEIIIYSIDEVFINLNPYKFKDLEKTVGEIKERIYQYIGLPVSIGVASTKTLAKAANFYAKRYKKFKNVLVFKDDETIMKALSILDISEIWGIGRQHKQFLKANGIHSALELRNANETFIKKHMTVTGLRTVKELKGFSCISVEGIREERKNIMHTRTFRTAVTNLPDLKSALATFTVRVAEKLRNQKSAANIIGVFIETSRFKNNDYKYMNSKMVNLHVPSDNSFELIKYVMQALDIIYVNGFKYKKAGVMAFGLQDSRNIQYSLFDNFDRLKHGEILKTVDLINSLYGRDTVRYTIQGNNTKISVQEKLSPRYTTSWDHIPEINTN
jgi:DNA polymerase V